MKGACSPYNNDTPGRKGPYTPNEPRVPKRADSQLLSSLILGLKGLWQCMVVLSGRAVVDGNPPGSMAVSSMIQWQSLGDLR